MDHVTEAGCSAQPHNKIAEVVVSQTVPKFDDTMLIFISAQKTSQNDMSH
jgi:hypothetical protein